MVAAPPPSRALLTFLLPLALAAPALAQGEARPPQMETSAAEVLRDGIAALGGEVLLDSQHLAFAFEGVSFAGEQAHDPAEPLATVQRVDRFWVDLEAPRTALESETTFPGEITFHNFAVFEESGVAQVDLARWRTGTDITRAPAQAAATNLAAIGRLLPHLAVRQAIAAGTAESAIADLGGRPHRTVAYRDPVGTEVTLFFDAETHLLSRFESRTGAQPLGAVTFSDYREMDEVVAPARRMQYVDETLTQDVRLTHLDLDAHFYDERFELPEGYMDPPAAREPEVVELAQGVYLLDHMRPFRYRSLFVEMEDHVVVMEAPLSAEYAELALGLIRQTVPEKPVRHVLVTHHHGDHVRGLPRFVAEGASLVVGEGVDTALRRQFDSLADADIEVVTERRMLGEGPGRIEILPVPNDHAQGNLAFYLPSARVLFQGDLFYAPDRGPVPTALAVSEALNQAIRAAGISVETIVGVHGRPVTRGEFEASLASRRTVAP